MKQSIIANTTQDTSQVAPNPCMEQSYHVFMLPFIVKEDVNPKHLEERLSVYDTTKWIHVCDKVLSDEEEARKAYNASKYFNKAAFEALHQTTKPPHKSWHRQHKDEVLEEFELKNLDPSRSYYRLDLNHFSAHLQLQSVRVKLYSHNIGQILYRTYYNEALFQKDKERKTVESYSYLDAVEDINSYGRRVSLPFVPQPEQGSYAARLTAVAAEISVSINAESSHNTTSYKTDFDQMAKSIVPAGSTAHTYQENAHHTIAKHAVGIIFNNTIREDKYHETIIPVYDDRMILASIISSDEAANLIPSYTEFKSLDEKTLSRISIYETEPDKAPYPNDMTAYKDARQLYGIISCDSHNDYTVRDASMLQNLMHKFSLDRWNEYKSYTGVSHHAFVMIKPPRDGNAFLFDNFSYLYVEMVSLVVVQRTALLNILHNTSEASRSIKGANPFDLQTTNRVFKFLASLVLPLRLIPRSVQATSRVAKIKQDIAVFTANINLLDITEQEQGDETYAKIRENLGVNTLSHNVKEQVEGLSDAAQAIRSSVYNAAAFAVAVGALVIETDADKLWWSNEAFKVAATLLCVLLTFVAISAMSSRTVRKKR
jgi:hypothetical protein